MKKARVLVTNPRIPRRAFELLNERCQVTTMDLPNVATEESLSRISGFDGVLWFSKTALNSSILDAIGPQLKVVSTMYVGLDNIDVSEIKSRGIQLGYTPRLSSDTIAEMTIFLILACLRRYREACSAILRGEWIDRWDGNWLLGRDIRGATVGIVGLGNVGQSIAKKINSFGIGSLYYTSRKECAAGHKLGATFTSFHDLLNRCQIVVVSCPLNGDTRGMFNQAAFAKMRKDAVLINVARGPIVHLPSLVEALETGAIYGAGLDVTEPEPLPPDHKLFTLPNCVVMPHLGSATVATRDEMAELAARNILLGLNNEPLLAAV